MRSNFSVGQYWQTRDLSADTQPVEKLRDSGRFGAALLPQWVISRQLCVFRTVDMAHVPRTDRAAALTLKLQQLSPFQASDHYVAWQGGTAMVWFWDADALTVALAEAGLARARVIPEPLLLPKPATGAAQDAGLLHIVQCRDGFDLQLWRDNCLQASRWLRHHPEPATSATFARKHALGHCPEPRTIKSAWLSEPWGRAPGGEYLDRLEPWLPRALAVVFCLALAWPLGSGLRWQSANAELRQQLDSLQQEVDPILTARNNARFAQSQVERLAALSPWRQTDLLFQLADLLPKDMRLERWTYRQGDIVLELRSANQDPRFYVRTLEERGGFEKVEVQPLAGENRLRLKFRVKS